jgi:hypothetical protein
MYTYKLTLTDSEQTTLAFVASRGYSTAVHGAVQHDDTTATQNPDGTTTYSIPEWLTWPIADELEDNGGHHFGPIADSLASKFYDLLGPVEL